MKAIIITEKELNEAFLKAEKNIESDTDFMYNDEIYSEFIKTKRYEMIKMFQVLLKETKQNISAT